MGRVGKVGRLDVRGSGLLHACLAGESVMMRFKAEKIVRWTLAAYMLWASASAFPPIVHRHAGGSSSHQHDSADGTSAASLHAIDSDAFVRGFDREICATADDLHQHGYVLLLGAAKHLPMRSAVGHPQGTSPCGWETVFTLGVAAPGARACLSGATWGQFELTPVSDSFVAHTGFSERREVQPSSVPSHSLLCDRARHERSGVLLA